MQKREEKRLMVNNVTIRNRNTHACYNWLNLCVVGDPVAKIYDPYARICVSLDVLLCEPMDFSIIY